MVCVRICVLAALAFALGPVGSPITAEGKVCRDQFLVTATNVSDGVELHIIPPSTGGGGQSYEQYSITGHSLSSECGDDYFRCGELFTVEVNVSPNDHKELLVQGTEHIALVPLAKALGLVKLVLNPNGRLYFSDVHVVDLTTEDCSFTSAYPIASSYNLVCLNSFTHSMSILVLHLNTTHISSSFISFTFPYSKAMFNFTNSVHVLSDEDLIFIAAGYDMVVFKQISENFQSYDIYLDRQKPSCFAVSIAYIGVNEMIVYCENGQAVYVNLMSESIYHTLDFATEGLPVICPDPNIYLGINIRSNYIQYVLIREKRIKNINIPMLDYDIGACIETENATYLVYTDRQAGVQLLQVPDNIPATLSPTSCLTYPCQRLMLLQDRYITVREKRDFSWFILVFDSQKNFSLLLEGQHLTADMMTVVRNNDACSQELIDGNQKQVPSDGEEDNRTSTSLIIVLPITVILVLLLIIGVIALLVVRWKIKKQKSSSKPSYATFEAIHLTPVNDERNTQDTKEDNSAIKETRGFDDEQQMVVGEQVGRGKQEVGGGGGGGGGEEEKEGGEKGEDGKGADERRGEDGGGGGGGGIGGGEDVQVDVARETNPVTAQDEEFVYSQANPLSPDRVRVASEIFNRFQEK